MGCQATTCRVCNKPYPACQIKNGVCATCRAEEERKSRLTDAQVKREDVTTK